MSLSQFLSARVRPARFLTKQTITFGSVAIALLAPARTLQAQNFRDAYGQRFQANQSAERARGPRAGLDSLHRWNQIAINASGVDHTPVAPGETRVFGEQLGPARASRAMAIVHIAMFDAVNAITGGYESYTGLKSKGGAVSLDAAISQAGHDTLVALFPSQAPAFDPFLADDVGRGGGRSRKEDGVESGRRGGRGLLGVAAGG